MHSSRPLVHSLDLPIHDQLLLWIHVRLEHQHGCHKGHRITVMHRRRHPLRHAMLAPCPDMRIQPGREEGSQCAIGALFREIIGAYER